MRQTFRGSVLAVAALCAGAAGAQDPADRMPGAIGEPATRQFEVALAWLHEVNRDGLEWGRVALERGSTKALRDYGQRLTRFHQDADSQVRDLARERDVSIGTPQRKRADLSSRAEREVLRALRGADFNSRYLTAVTTFYQRKLSEVRNLRRTITDEDLGSLMEEVEGEISASLQQAQELRGTRPAARRAPAGR